MHFKSPIMKGARLSILVFVACLCFVLFYTIFFTGVKVINDVEMSALQVKQLTTPPDYLIPPENELTNVDENKMMKIYWKYINRLQVLCKDVIRVGSLKDGGKEICVDEPYRSSAPCLVYSFGINYQWDFDKAIVDTFGCDVHCFDPSMKNNTMRVSEHIWFYKWGLGGSNEVNNKGWPIKTLDTIRKELGHTNRSIDILKIDIEGDEWKAIPQMITSGVLDDVKQISMETHFSKDRSTGSKYWGNTKPLLHLSGLRQLYELGFRTFMRERNLWSHQLWPGFNGYITNVNEISLIKVNNLRL